MAAAYKPSSATSPAWISAALQCGELALVYVCRGGGGGAARRKRGFSGIELRFSWEPPWVVSFEFSLSGW